MRTMVVKIVVAAVLLPSARQAFAQDSSSPAYLNSSLPAEQRAQDLVKRMTVEEKVTQLTNQSRAVHRLNIPAYNWWSEALHGVASSGTTEFPEPVGLAATFDTDAIQDRDLSMVSNADEPIISEGKYSLSIGGGQPATAAPTVVGTFEVRGTKTLPE